MYYLFYAIVIAYLTVAMIMDLLFRRVKNWWIIVGYILSIVLNLYYHNNLIYSLYGFFLPTPLLIFYRHRMIGAGDIKLLSVAGCYLGFSYMIKCLLPILFFSVILSVIEIIRSIPNLTKGIFSFRKFPLTISIMLGITTTIIGGDYLNAAKYFGSM